MLYEEDTKEWEWWEKNVPILVYVVDEIRFYIVYYFRKHKIEEKVQVLGIDGEPLYVISKENPITAKVIHDGEQYDAVLTVFSTLDSKRRLVMVGKIEIREVGLKWISAQLYPNEDENKDLINNALTKTVITSPDLMLFRNFLISEVRQWLKREYGKDLKLVFISTRGE